MSTTMSKQHTYDPNLVEVKAKFECEFRRFCLDQSQTSMFSEFHSLIKSSHHLPTDMPFTISYTDPRNGDLLPINNDDNMLRAFGTAQPLLRIFVHRQQDRRWNVITRCKKGPTVTIGPPENFHYVGGIMDADLTVRRVKLLKYTSDQQLGIYIREGTSIKVTAHGIETIPGIFISRLVPNGLAKGTGLLGVNDEIIEVNGIEVAGKTLDQVTDMMVANSQNLIITVKPASDSPSTPQILTRSGGTSQAPLSTK